MSDLVRLSVAEREAVVARLSDAFAHDLLPLDEFERRCAEAYRAPSAAALAALVSDLPVQAPVRQVDSSAPAPLPQRIRAVFGNVERGGVVEMPARLEITSLFGNVELDLADAHFGAGVTEISVRAVFGNVEITLPAHATVENHGSGILASFTCRASRGSRTGQGGPVVRITGSALLANVEIASETE